MSDEAVTPDFRQYQLQFAAHIRDPQRHTRPDKLNAGRMRVYRDMVFHGLESSLAACFPVSKQVLGKRLWYRLVRGFLADHRALGPLFRQMPEEFLRYLETCSVSCSGQLAGAQLPGYLFALAHYEWMELALAAAEAGNSMEYIDTDGDLLMARPAMTAVTASLRYDYAVHRISPRRKPQTSLAQPVHLFMFRDADDRVRFIEINALTARLLALLQPGNLTGRQALLQLAAEVGQAESQPMLTFGNALLQDLRAQGVLLGTYDGSA